MVSLTLLNAKNMWDVPVETVLHTQYMCSGLITTEPRKCGSFYHIVSNDRSYVTVHLWGTTHTWARARPRSTAPPQPSGVPRTPGRESGVHSIGHTRARCPRFQEKCEQVQSYVTVHTRGNAHAWEHGRPARRCVCAASCPRSQEKGEDSDTRQRRFHPATTKKKRRICPVL